MGGLLLNGDFISWLFAYALRIGEKKGKKYSSKNIHFTQNKDVLCNPQNPVNPDSKPSVRDKYPLDIILENYPFFFLCHHKGIISPRYNNIKKEATLLGSLSLYLKQTSYQIRGIIRCSEYILLFAFSLNIYKASPSLIA